MFIDGFLGLLSATANGSATEFTVPGYARQPISFACPINGSSPSARSYTFGTLGTPGPMGNTLSFAGRAVWDAPTGGNLLLVLPLPAPRPLAGGGPSEAAQAGFLHLALDALAPFPDGAAYSGALPAQAVIGSHYDELAVTNNRRVNPATGGYIIEATTAPLWSGVALRVVRGILAAA